MKITKKLLKKIILEQQSLSFKQANEKIHKVEDQWHYKFLIKYGFKPITPTGKGLVRSYQYKGHGHTITASTGVHADHWKDENTGTGGYWADLEPYLKKLVIKDENQSDLEKSKQTASSINDPMKAFSMAKASLTNFKINSAKIFLNRAKDLGLTKILLKTLEDKIKPLNPPLQLKEEKIVLVIYRNCKWKVIGDTDSGLELQLLSDPDITRYNIPKSKVKYIKN